MKILNIEVNKEDIIRIKYKRLEFIGWFSNKMGFLGKLFKADFSMCLTKIDENPFDFEHFKIKHVKKIELLRQKIKNNNEEGKNE